MIECIEKKSFIVTYSERNQNDFLGLINSSLTMSGKSKIVRFAEKKTEDVKVSSKPKGKEEKTKKMKTENRSDSNFSLSASYNLKTDLDLSAYSSHESSSPSDYEPPLRKINAIRLTWLTSQEIENMSVAEIKSSKLNGVGSVYDPRYGTIVDHEKCSICSQTWKDCPGHMGSMKLPYAIPHPVVLKHLADLLTCFCQICHRLVLTWKQMKTLGILEYRKESRFRSFISLAKKAIRCSHCKKPHGRYIVSDDKFLKCYKKRTDIKFPITYEEVVSILLNIRDQEMVLLGFKDPLSHPRHMIISNLCVLPPSARPWVRGGSGIMHDDLTHKYIEIEKRWISSTIRL